MPSQTLDRRTVAEAAGGGARKFPSMVSEAVDNGVRLAKRAAKRGRYAAEDAMDEAEHQIRQKPFQTMIAAFVGGIATGGLLVWFGRRR